MANYNNPFVRRGVNRAPIAFSTAIVCLSFAISLLAGQSPANSPKSNTTSPLSVPVDFGSANGYPELRISGTPFFIHAAYFDYFSVPRDLWERSLDSYRDFEINTIALRIPWNWHEPREGEFDFAGRTNPRRDLRALLRLMSDKGFKLIVAPGPVFDSPESTTWRDGGLPEWLASREATDPAKQQVAEDARTRAAESWLAAVAGVLAPYSATTFPAGSAASAPLLYVILGAPAALHDPSDGAFWPHAAESQAAMISAGLHARFLVTAAGPQHAAIRAPTHFAFDVAGRWTLARNAPSADLQATEVDPLLASAADPLAALVQSLRLDSAVPALIDDFSIAPHSSGAPPPTHEVADMFLTWAYQIARGAGGIVQSGIQQTLPPPGFRTEDFAAQENDHAILDVSGTLLRVAERARREGDLVHRLGAFFASAHPRTVLGIVDLRAKATYADALDAKIRAESTSAFALALPKITRIADLAQIPTELADPGTQDASRLLHDPVLLLAIPDSLRNVAFLSDEAQQSLLNFVHQGGSLVCEPDLPLGESFAEALRDVSPLSAGDGVLVRNLGSGRVISWSKDFYSWVNPDEDVARTRERPEAAWAAENLLVLIKEQSASLPVLRAEHPLDALYISELVANAAQAPQDSVHAAAPRNQGLLAVANWSDTAANETVRVLPPSVSARAATEDDYVELPLSLRSRDALFLPLDAPLCNAAKFPGACEDRVVAAGAELVSYTREGKTLEITFYAPEKATIIVSLEAPPHRVELLERTLEGQYNTGSHDFTFELPRGAAPGFLRTVKFEMPYTPHVLEAPKPDRSKLHDFRATVVNAFRYPLGAGQSLGSYPPLLALDPQLYGRLLLNMQNLGDSFLTIHADISGAVSASRVIRLDAKERNDYAFDLRPGDPAKPDSDGLLHATLHLSSADRTSDIPLDLIAGDPASTAHYRADFERSGSKNWVLENNQLRVVTAPATGGIIAAIVDNHTETGLLAPTGGLFDLVATPGSRDLQDVTLNASFDPSWLPSANETSPITGVQLAGVIALNSQARIQITKKIELIGWTKLALQYEAQLLSPGNTPAPSLVTGFSIPAFTGASGTQFCWSSPAAASRSESSGTSAWDCEPFTPNSGSLKLPEKLQRLEIREHNRTVFVFECHSGFISIDQQNSSARILWNLPPLSATANSASSAQTNLATLTIGDDH